jgi:hypothetical protein
MTLKDKRKPRPIDVDKAKRLANVSTITLATPDIQVSTPVLQKLLIQNNLADGTLVKQENLNDDTGSDNISSSMSNTEEVTTVQQTDAIEIESGETIQATTADGQTIQLKSSAVTQAILTAGININGNNMVLPHQPIDMTAQEEEKLDRKRQRNRVAATKCRKRKIERITQLEQEVRELNDALQKRLKQKRELEIEVDEIRNRLKIHIKQGCSGLEEYLQD